MPCTTTWSRQTAGDDAIFPFGVACFQRTLPLRIFSALIVPRELPMYATPSWTTAGNSISDPSPRDQTTRNGGRTFRLGCARVRRGAAPYIVHCSERREMWIVDLRPFRDASPPARPSYPTFPAGVRDHQRPP